MITHYAPGDSILRKLGIDWAVIGVHIFFVLSGFLITKLLSEKYFATDRFMAGFAAFLVARTVRIIPLAFFALAVVALLSTEPLPKGFFEYNLTFTSNIYTARTGEWFPDVGHYWSLAVEMQFYLIFPFFVWAFRRRLLPALIIATAALYLLQEVVARYSGFANPGFLLTGRADAFLLGGILFCMTKRPDFAFFAKMALAFGCTVYVGQSFGREFLQTSAFISQMPIANLLFAGLVGVAMLNGSVVDRVFSNHILVHFGKVSYGIYIWHPIMWLVYPFLNNATHGAISRHVSLILLLVLLTIGFAEASWHLFEKQLNTIGHRWSSKILKGSHVAKNDASDFPTQPAA
ncbi:acyltransferase [Paraburkholderia sp. FT54]|uniref:acyltransferase family protein n=1 Tax=Paraburkholderia sp. FT54 TaxID=3074437 RepID=UPI002877E655|nr:acyltransferase [Paraburkholderia sp. FT54]WNC90970.1 acyltransferase [Paraburkholderia sp. FT54]